MKRNNSIGVYTPSFLERLIEGKGLDDARKRVTVTTCASGKHKYKYEPSSEYKKFLSKHATKFHKKH